MTSTITLARIKFKFLLTITKYVATRRNPEDPKALQVRVPSKKAAPIPESDNPETKSGEPKVKMMILLSKADCHVGGED